jgi:glycosyltransferase involved in cell wall biosynthesis
MSNLRVNLEPHFNKPDKADGGVRRVLDAQRKYLPQFGVQLVEDKAKADLTVGHGTIANIEPGKPFVSHSHGLHWDCYKWDEWAHEVNRNVIDAMLAAEAVTVPSQWVKRAFGRGMMRDVTVIYHGVDAAEWKHAEPNEGYILWNKPRHDQVSDSNDVAVLAKQMTDARFVATLAPAKLDNLSIIGALPYEEMKPIVQRAGVYLATARETFGIGTLEALAAGVPVAGWRHGGQVEIVIEGETGYLAEYGDYAALAECVRKCIAQRKRLSHNARADAEARWQWSDKIAQYAELYKRVLKAYRASPKVSIILTCHDLARFLPDALHSVAAQTMKDWECLIVDDASKDETPKVAQEWAEADPRFIYQRTPDNLKLSLARNFGLMQARGKYIVNLDADDMLTPDALILLAAALDKDPMLHIAYGGLDTMSDNGENIQSNPFPPKFNWLNQMAHLNCLPYCAMMRRGVLDMTGGYRERQWRAEDAEMWCRVTSYGWRAAKVTDKPALVYRIRSDSKGALERKKYADIDGEWTAGFPWHIALTGAEGAAKTKAQNVRLPNTHLIPFGAPELSGETWKIWHGEEPTVSVVIPLGPKHERYVIDALDSLIAQTVGTWEAIIINDTGKPISEIAGAQYARILTTKGKQGAGVARNLGIQAARAPLVLFLDADDTLRPDALMLMLTRYAKGDCGYVYTDWVTTMANGALKPGRANEYQPVEWLYKGQHAVTVLMATEDARKVGGFDEEMIGWEDWDFFVKCNVAGICGAHIPEGLLNYREFTGARRGAAFDRKEELLGLLQKRYIEYTEGSKQLMPCRGGCGGAKKAAQRGIESMESRVMANQEARPDRVRMEFVGRQTGPITYTVNGHSYQGANTDENRFVDVPVADAEKLSRLNIWRRVTAEQQGAPISAPIAPAPLPPAPPPPETKVVPVYQSAVLTVVDGDGNPIKRTIPVQAQAPIAEPVAVTTTAPATQPEQPAPKRRARKPKSTDA